MSTDKSSYVRFELRFDPELSAQLDDWLEARVPAITKADFIRDLIKKHMEESDLDPIVISEKDYQIIDNHRAARRPILSRQKMFANWIKSLID